MSTASITLHFNRVSLYSCIFLLNVDAVADGLASRSPKKEIRWMQKESPEFDWNYSIEFSTSVPFIYFNGFDWVGPLRGQHFPMNRCQSPCSTIGMHKSSENHTQTNKPNLFGPLQTMENDYNLLIRPAVSSCAAFWIWWCVTVAKLHRHKHKTHTKHTDCQRSTRNPSSSSLKTEIL